MRDLTLADATQVEIMRHLSVTEELLSRAASAASGADMEAEVWGMPDLGMANSIARMHGGFFTGAVYHWESRVPIVPVDATVNSCGVSLYRVTRDITSREEFDQLIESARSRIQGTSSYMWNWSVGNHFIIYGQVSQSATIPPGRYLVLHSSASEFKKTSNGLYPVPGNWYADKIKVIHHTDRTRYLRYVDGKTAERFIGIAQMLQDFNRRRHEFFAGQIVGENSIEDEVINLQHYGMPSADTVAIGCQWLASAEMYLLLTAPGRPLFFVQTQESVQNRAKLGDRFMYLHPHGLGKASDAPLHVGYQSDSLQVNGREYALTDTLEGSAGFRLRGFAADEMAETGIPALVRSVLAQCPGDVVATLAPLYSYHSRLV